MTIHSADAAKQLVLDDVAPNLHPDIAFHFYGPVLEAKDGFFVRYVLVKTPLPDRIPTVVKDVRVYVRRDGTHVDTSKSSSPRRHIDKVEAYDEAVAALLGIVRPLLDRRRHEFEPIQLETNSDSWLFDVPGFPNNFRVYRNGYVAEEPPKVATS